jgi:hypothetical protein
MARGCKTLSAQGCEMGRWRDWGGLGKGATSRLQGSTRDEDRKRFRSGSVRTRFTTSGPLPNPGPDFGSGSGPVPNFEPDFGPVRKGSGPNRGSEPDPGNTIWEDQVREAKSKNIVFPEVLLI